LKRIAAKAVAWSGLDIFLRRGLQFLFSVVLARLLGPDAFGTIALIYIFTAIAGVFVDSGFSVALIQNQEITHTDESTVFWFNLSLGLLLTVVLCAFSPLIATFYALPDLMPLISVSATSILLTALGSIHATILSKNLDFRTQMKVGVIANGLSGFIAVAMAIRGYGVWTLVTQIVIASGINSTLLWTVNPWRPSAVFSSASAKRLFGFGGYMFAATLIDTVYSKFYTVLIGKVFGVKELGFYNNADETKQIPAAVLTSILARVAFPMFSVASGKSDQLRRGVQLGIRTTMLFNVPLMLGMAAVAEPLTLTLFGSAWLPSVPIMRILCIGGMLWPLHLINLNVLIARGSSHLFFRIEIFKKTIGLSLLLAGSIYGVIGIAWSQVVFSVVAFLINSYCTKRFFGYGATEQALDFLPALTIAVPMSSFVYWLSFHLSLSPPVNLLCLAAAGGSIFFSLAISFKLTAIKEIENIFKSL
jgi:teichuronic acid exporter